VTEIGVIRMSVTDQCFVNRFPWVQINSGLFAKNSLIGELKKVQGYN
jgi:hypothetical protein